MLNIIMPKKTKRNIETWKPIVIGCIFVYLTFVTLADLLILYSYGADELSLLLTIIAIPVLGYIAYLFFKRKFKAITRGYWIGGIWIILSGLGYDFIGAILGITIIALTYSSKQELTH